MNLVSTMIQFLTPMIVNKIASSLGMSNAMATTAIGALLPSILAGLTGKASTPAGASALSSMLGQQDSNILGSFANMLGGSGQTSLISGGTSALSSLLGGSATNALSGAIGKFTGASSQQSSNLMGMLAPVVLGSLAQTQKSSGLDANGLASMLQGQKANIAAAMPAGFSQLLGGSGLLDSISDQMKGASPTAAPAKYDIPRTPEAPEFNWMPWAAGGVALLGLIWAFSGNKTAPTPTPAAIEKTTAPAVPASTPATAAMDQAKSLIAGLSSSLGNVKDAATAQAALPQLTSSAAAIDVLSKTAGGLAPDAKSQLAALIGGAMPQLSQLMATVLKIPGAEAILKPVLDTITAKLTGLSKA